MNAVPTRQAVAYPRSALRSRAKVASDIAAVLAGQRAAARNGRHLGGGADRIEGLTNCDLFHPAADLKADATDLHMLADASVDWIESHHMVEHLSFAEARTGFAEWHRVLAPGGFLVLTCPDITRVCRLWLLESARHRIRPRPERLDQIARMFAGPQIHAGMFHRNVFDARRLSGLLVAQGFSVDFTHTPYPIRPTPSLLVIARR